MYTYLKYTLLLSTLVSTAVRADLVDDAVSLAKGSVGTGVSAASAIAAIVSLSEGVHHLTDKTNRNLGKATLNLGSAVALGYAVSKIAPFSRKALLLRNPSLVSNKPVVADSNTGLAIVKGLAAGTVGATALCQVSRGFINGAKQVAACAKEGGAKSTFSSLTSTDSLLSAAVVAGYSYAAYKALPYAYTQFRKVVASS